MYKFDGEINFSNKLYINKVVENVTVINAIQLSDDLKEVLIACCRCGKPQIEIFHKGNITKCVDTLKKLTISAEVVLSEKRETFDLTFEDLLEIERKIDSREVTGNEFDKLAQMLGHECK